MAVTDVKKTSEIEVIEKATSKVNHTAEVIEIKDTASLAVATDLLTEISKYAKQIKAQKEKVTKPLNEALKNYRDMFRPIETQIDDAKASIKAKMLAYERKVDAENKAKLEKLEDRVDRGTMRQDTAIRKASELDSVDSTVFGNSGKATFSTVKVVKITDMEQFIKSGAFTDYIKRDSVLKALMVEVRKDALGNKAQGVEPVVIPGVTVTDEKTVY